MKIFTIGLVLLGLTIFTGIQAYAVESRHESKPDLSGKWIMDTQKSHAGPGLEATFWASRLTIVQQDAEISITWVITGNGPETTIRRIYFTDGRPGSDTNAPDARPVSKWHGWELVSKWSSPEAVDPNLGWGNTITNKSETIWALSPDGNTLSYTARYQTKFEPQGRLLGVAVFNRAPSN